MTEHLPIERYEDDGFRLDRRLIHDWAEDILRDGDVRDYESRQAMELFDKISQATAENEFLAGAVELTDRTELENQILTTMFEGLSELSEGLEYYGDVSAVVADAESGTEKEILITGLELNNADSYQVSVRSSDGDLYLYEDLKKVIIPSDK